MSKKEEAPKMMQMPSLDAPALTAVAASFRLRAARLASRDDILSIELRLRFLKAAERTEEVIRQRFPDEAVSDEADAAAAVDAAKEASSSGSGS